MRSYSSSNRRRPASHAVPLLAALAICGVFAGSAEAAASPALAAPVDLHADGALAATRGSPLVVLFSLPECQYCAVVRRNYLAPLTRTPREADRLVVRELELTSTTPLAGFHGERTSGSLLAARYGLAVAPSVVMLDRDGKLLTAPLLGGDVAGMYGAYLDRALDEARAKLEGAASLRSIDPKP
ncbi:thioredoxin [Massilia sp. TWR1-2-2]|uniref:thioredoxin n=1 Tax=Massilia sp. TWR1-2-2 TaxID=2804584 RepID=UPI003CE87FB6